MRSIRNYVHCLCNCFSDLKPPLEAEFCAAVFSEEDLNSSEFDSTSQNYKNNLVAINEADEKRKRLQYNLHIQSVESILNRYMLKKKH